MRFDEIRKMVIRYLAEGMDPEPLIKVLEKIEEELLIDLPRGLEGRVYARASEVIRDLIRALSDIYTPEPVEEIRYQEVGASDSHQPVGARTVEGEQEPQRGVYGPIGGSEPLLLVRFKTQTAKIVGVDMKVYGPFSEGDLAWIPEENAKALVEKGAAEVIEE